MNLKRRTLSDQHGDAADLTKFQSYLHVRGKESIFDRTSFGPMARNDFFQSVGNAQEPRGKFLGRRSAHRSAFDQAIVPAIVFDDAPTRRLTTRIYSQDAHMN